MSEAQWDRLQCPFCPSKRFVRVVNLRASRSGGTVDEPAGLRCADCQADIDVRMLLERQQIDAKRRELAALEEEVRGLESPVVAVGAEIPPPAERNGKPGKAK